MKFKDKVALALIFITVLLVGYALMQVAPEWHDRTVPASPDNGGASQFAGRF